MKRLSDSGVNDTIVGVTLGATLLGLALWLGWRRPGLLLVFALASLAIRPELLWGGPRIGYEWGLHQTLLVLALIANALHFGVHRSTNWPIAALIVVFGLSLAFGNLRPDLTVGFMLMSLALLALPFAFTQVILAPDIRRACVLVIALTPLLSAALGGLLQFADVRATFAGQHNRLQGLSGNAAVFATLAFAGFAVALHESSRQNWPWAVALAAANLALVILSGTRMAILASAVLLVAYVLMSPRFRERLQRSPVTVLSAVCLVGAALAFYMPTIYIRIFGALDRLDVWEFFFREFQLSPIFGRGIGSGFADAVDWPEHLEKPSLATPHNEYLHLLVMGGVVGFALCMAAIVLWYYRLMRAASPDDRAFLIAFVPAIAIYAITDNVLIYSSALALYAYLGVLHQVTAPASSPQVAGVGHAGGASAATCYEPRPVPAQEGDDGRSC